jgi:hypothetical protein
MKANEIIAELFQAPPTTKWKWIWNDERNQEASFTIDDTEYVFRARRLSGRPPYQWIIEFKNVNGEYHNDRYGLSGTGNSALVMTTIVGIMREFLLANGDQMLGMSFSAKEMSRRSLYLRIIKKLLPTWTVSQSDDTDDGYSDFVVTRPQVTEPAGIDK